MLPFLSEYKIYPKDVRLTAKGPSAGIEVHEGPGKAAAFVRAELGSTSLAAGPMKATAALSADTGLGVSAGSVEAKVLGTGFTVGLVKGGAEISSGGYGIVEMIDTFDRPGKAFTKGTYAGTNKYAVGLEDKPGKRIPRAGVSASAGVGHARAEWSVYEAEAKGPNASAGIGASAGSLSASAFARAEVGSASAAAGPLTAKVGLSADTGVTVGATQIEAKVLGCGFSFGSKMGFSLLGSGFEFKLW
ncbi:Structure-specific endonuclease subunit slx4 [Dissostichus eleginoides]|uniref:Structure-specific endonuclease subunit slx4 n=1 Tax=Dissostichus eleginoides TaxID=100907 RepID=A0AAD9FDX8_DISEL|nr:Structure-specific endonuclease subunit slx4 [Dissostichus eleginoides]